MDLTQPTMVVLRPGDRVLVALNNEPVEDEVEVMHTVLAQSFPGVQFVIATDVHAVAVEAAPATPQQIRAARIG